ncbi:hypothetical protein BAE44_0014406, partial [Dichanthelium oligosanthes]
LQNKTLLNLAESVARGALDKDEWMYLATGFYERN